MPFYEAATTTTLVTASANAPLVALRAVSAALFVQEIHIFYRTAPTTSGALGLVRSTALGTGTLTSVAGQARMPLTGMPAATGIIVTNWATLAPTLSATTYSRRFSASPTIGNGVIWTFDGNEQLGVAGSAGATSELIIANLVATAPGTFDVVVIWRE